MVINARSSRPEAEAVAKEVEAAGKSPTLDEYLGRAAAAIAGSGNYPTEGPTDAHAGGYAHASPTAAGTAGSGDQTFSNTPTGTNDWTDETFTFAATGSSTLLSLLGSTSVSTNYIGLDRITISEVTPIPASALLFGTALLGLGLATRRSRKGAEPTVA